MWPRRSTIGATPGRSSGRATTEGPALDIVHWREHDDVLALKALGWVLPAIVSGLREESFGSASARSFSIDSSANGDSAERPTEAERQAAYVRSARQALEW